MTPPKDTLGKAAKVLADNVTKLMNAETFQAALKSKSKFHQYSLNNCFLIFIQCPTASYVAGYRAWQNLGRQVRKGEKAISILAPVIRKVEEGGEEVKRLVGFKTASVFDVSQTDGGALPELPRPETLTGDSKEILELLAALEKLAESKGFPVKRKAILGSALGKFSLTTHTISLRDDLEPLQSVKTLVHELAHALMHQSISPNSDRRHLCELEAESCAFLVCQALGLDTSRYSFAYLANWATSPAELLPAAERAAKTADVILETLRGLFFLKVIARRKWCELHPRADRREITGVERRF